MPCDSVMEVTVEFSEATDLDALALALEALGLVGVRRESEAVVFQGGAFQRGEFVLRGTAARSFPQTDVLKRAYTKATVLNAADKFAWVAAPAKALVAAVAGFSRKW